MSAHHVRSLRRTAAIVVLACDVVVVAAIGVAVGTPHHRAAPAPARMVRVVTSQCVDGLIVNAVDDGGPGLLAVDTGVSC